MLSYNFNIPFVKFNEFLSDEKTKRDATSKNAQSFIGATFMDPLMVAMNEKEKSTDLDLQVDKSRIYSDSKKAPNYISINAHCRKCTTKYTIIVKHNPTENEQYEFEVKKSTQHDQAAHDSKKVVVKGFQRDILAQSVLLSKGGSAKAYHDAQTGKGLTNLPSQNVIAKAVSSYVNKEMASTNWITNILHQAAVVKICLKGKQIHGYVHDFVVTDHFSITLELESQ